VADELSIGTEIGDLEWLYITLNGVMTADACYLRGSWWAFCHYFRQKANNLFYGSSA